MGGRWGVEGVSGMGEKSTSSGEAVVGIETVTFTVLRSIVSRLAKVEKKEKKKQ